MFSILPNLNNTNKLEFKTESLHDSKNNYETKKVLLVILSERSRSLYSLVHKI